MIGKIILWSLLALLAVIILAIVLILLLLRVGLHVEQQQDDLTVRVRVGSKILPPNPQRIEKAKQTLDDWKETQPDGDLALLRDFLPTILRTIVKLCGKVKVEKLDLTLIVGAENPYNAAVEYGRANALLGALWAPVVSLCRVKDGNARVSVDFQQKKPTFYLLADATVSAGQLLVIAIVFVGKLIKIQYERTKRNSEPEERRIEHGTEPSNQ
ncbi:MAG: DUF2953 domain-containing protein [Ruminococcaceae bacterium]|nr:DUF2953 domain-containing protein [Oscillospiraceae bacterium]